MNGLREVILWEVKKASISGILFVFSFMTPFFPYYLLSFANSQITRSFHSLVSVEISWKKIIVFKGRIKREYKERPVKTPFIIIFARP